MKRLMMIAVSALLLMGMSAFAQEAQPAQGQQGGGQRRGGMMGTPAERANRLAEQLKLSDDQKAKVQKIYEDAPGMDKMRDMSPEDRRAAMMATNDKVKEVLNDDQKKQFEEMMQRRGGGGRPQGGDSGGQKPPSL
jgi:periplasmic protein CpxP/Spy